jgi:DNA polymerase-3 subunit delta'
VDRERWTALSCGTLRYLDPAAFQRATEQLEAWLSLALGATFGEAGKALAPDKADETSQSEQVRRCLELLLLALGDLGRLREGKPIRLAPWVGELERIAQSPLALEPVQAQVFEALRSLGRNPFADSLLREVALACR